MTKTARILSEYISAGCPMTTAEISALTEIPVNRVAALTSKLVARGVLREVGRIPASILGRRGQAARLREVCG